MIKQLDQYSYSRINNHQVPYRMINFLIHTLNYNVYIDSGLGTDALLELSHYGQKDKANILILTHHDYDHVWGSGALKFKHIYGHASINDRIQADQVNIELYQQYKEFDIQINMADTLVSKDTEIDGLNILQAPGHTSDSIVVYDKRTMNLFIGDNIGDQDENMVPDLEDVDAYRETLSKLMQLPIINIYGSHRNRESASTLIDIMKSLTSKFK
jgi:glyoxylase-like metal-dependent hydrolase (beta-lactamase superfamily II)